MLLLTKFQNILLLNLKTAKDTVIGMATEGKTGLLDLHIVPRIPLHPTESTVQGQRANHFLIPGVIQMMGTNQEAYQGLPYHGVGLYHLIGGTVPQENVLSLLTVNIPHEDPGHP